MHSSKKQKYEVFFIYIKLFFLIYLSDCQPVKMVWPSVLLKDIAQTMCIDKLAEFPLFSSQYMSLSVCRTKREKNVN